MSSIDVAVPCYQYGRFLGDCVRSVLGQNVESLRVLIIDNASTDDSLEVAQDLAAGDSRVEVVAHRTNLGQHASFNEAIDWAQADYFLILGADDLVSPGALRRAMNFLDGKGDVHLACGRVVRTTADLEQLPAERFEGEWRVVTGAQALERFCTTGTNLVDGATAVVRTAVQKKIGHYRPSLKHTDDFEMWLRFASHGGIGETTAVQALARDLPASSAKAVRIWQVEFEAAFRSFFSREGAALADAERLDRLWRKSLSEQAYLAAAKCLLKGRFGTAAGFLRCVHRLSSTSVLVPPVGYVLRRGWEKALSVPRGNSLATP